MRKLILGLFCTAAAFAVSAPANATAFFDDFEGTTFSGTGYAILPTYGDWTTSFGPGIEVQYGNVAGLAHSGRNLVELDSDSNSNMSRSIDAGSYTLSFYYSDRPGIGAASNGIDVLLNGVSILPIAGGDGSSGTVWSLKTVSFTAAPGTNILTFAALGTSDSLGGYLDDINLAGAVPEPAAWAMMVLGFGAIGSAMRRRKASVRFAF